MATNRRQLYSIQEGAHACIDTNMHVLHVNMHYPSQLLYNIFGGGGGGGRRDFHICATCSYYSMSAIYMNQEMFNYCKQANNFEHQRSA